MGHGGDGGALDLHTMSAVDSVILSLIHQCLPFEALPNEVTIYHLEAAAAISPPAAVHRSAACLAASSRDLAAILPPHTDCVCHSLFASTRCPSPTSASPRVSQHESSDFTHVDSVLIHARLAPHLALMVLQLAARGDPELMAMGVQSVAPHPNSTAMCSAMAAARLCSKKEAIARITGLMERFGMSPMYIHSIS